MKCFRISHDLAQILAFIIVVINISVFVIYEYITKCLYNLDFNGLIVAIK